MSKTRENRLMKKIRDSTDSMQKTKSRLIFLPFSICGDFGNRACEWSAAKTLNQSIVWRRRRRSVIMMICRREREDLIEGRDCCEVDIARFEEIAVVFHCHHLLLAAYLLSHSSRVPVFCFVFFLHSQVSLSLSRIFSEVFDSDILVNCKRLNRNDINTLVSIFF